MTTYNSRQNECEQTGDRPDQHFDGRKMTGRVTTGQLKGGQIGATARRPLAFISSVRLDFRVNFTGFPFCGALNIDDETSSYGLGHEDSGMGDNSGYFTWSVW